APTPEQFHIEFTERAAKKAAAQSSNGDEAPVAAAAAAAAPAPVAAAAASPPSTSVQESTLVSAFTNLPGLQRDPNAPGGLIFRQRLEIHLPATTDIAVYDAIFKS